MAFFHKSIAAHQQDVATWLRHNFPNESPMAGALGLAEESGEVARAVLKRAQGIRGTAEEWSAELRKEVADVFFRLCQVAEVEGFSLSEAIHERWEVVRHRDFRADPSGHGLPEDDQ